MSKFLGQNQYNGLTTKERFWQKVEILKKDDCWEWIAGKCSKGYGTFWVDERIESAPRYSYKTNVADIPAGMHVLHTCDNPGCVNPKHLYLGTNADNVADREAKGGHHDCKGEANPFAKLTDDKVLWIRELVGKGIRQQTVADLFGVTQQTVSKVASGFTWSHIRSNL